MLSCKVHCCYGEAAEVLARDQLNSLTFMHKVGLRRERISLRQQRTRKETAENPAEASGEESATPILK